MKNEKGFSLIELLVVVVLIAIVATIAFMSGDVIKRHRLTAASRQLYGDLQKVRVDAMTRSPSGTSSRGFGIKFNSTTTYTAFEFNDTNGDFQYAGTGEEANTRQTTMPDSITIQRKSGGSLVDPSGSNDDIVIFDKKGLAKNNNWSPIGGTYVLQYTNLSEKRCIMWDDVRIREGVWDGSACQKQ